jgi:hypothetical protein
MKIGGKRIDSKPASEFLVFPRQDGDIAIRANAVMDRADFDRLVPLPKMPKKRIKGGESVDNPDDPRYLTLMNQHGQKFIEWLIVESLCGVNKETQEDEPIEWEKVIRGKPDTWKLWDEEFKEVGFSDMERKRIHGLVISVNSLSESRLDEARASFLLPKEEEPEPSSSPSSEQVDTPSGEPANDSESDPQESLGAGTISNQK